MKGLSQIASAVVLLAIGVTLVSFYAGWATDFASQIAGKAANQTNTDIKCSNVALSVENAIYDKTGEVVTFDLENTGTIRIVNGLNAGTFNSSLTTGRTTMGSLDVGETREISVITPKIPERILISVVDCPSVNIEETKIEVKE